MWKKLYINLDERFQFSSKLKKEVVCMDVHLIYAFMKEAAAHARKTEEKKLLNETGNITRSHAFII